MSIEKRPLKVFLSYASQDQPAVREIYDALKREAWIDPWLDKEMILPGQDWEMVIEKAVDDADVVIICLSNQSVPKEGYVQKEIRYAYDIALEKPDETIFLIPLRLDDCEIPRKLRFLHKVDYFGVEKTHAYADLLASLKLRYEQKLSIENHDRREKRKLESTTAGNPVVKGVKPETINKTTPKKLKRGSAENPVGTEISRTEKVRKKRRRKGMNPTILAALIGGVITIIAALIPFFVNQFSSLPTSTLTTTRTVEATSTEVAFITDTATPNTPTFTPVPATDTSFPTPTGIPPISLGTDFPDGCISTLWRPYPPEITTSERGDGCWNEPVYVFYAENGDLDVLAQSRNEETQQIYGLFARLPESGKINVTVRLNELTNVDVWLGIFAEQDVTSQGLLMTIPHGNVLKRVIVQKDPRTNETITDTSLLEQGTGFSFSFTFNANSARSILNPSVFFTESVSIPSSQKWLFLGYKSLLGYYRIEGRFLEFELE